MAVLVSSQRAWRHIDQFYKGGHSDIMTPRGPDSFMKGRSDFVSVATLFRGGCRVLRFCVLLISEKDVYERVLERR